VWVGRKEEPDIILLDVMLNGSIDGFELARQIRLEKDTQVRRSLETIAVKLRG
jgi:DNA-binding response OmpR family regulator